MSDVIIFGANDFAQLAKYYLEHDSEHRVICFTAHKEYIHTNIFEGLPLQDLETTLK